MPGLQTRFERLYPWVEAILYISIVTFTVFVWLVTLDFVNQKFGGIAVAINFVVMAPIVFAVQQRAGDWLESVR